MDLEDAVQHLVKKYNYHPDREYELQVVKTQKTATGGKIWNSEKFHPYPTIHLPRKPASGYTSIYDLKDQKDFQHYFEKRFPNLPDGRYTAMTSRGGNKGFAWLFVLDYRNGEVKNWIKKSKATNKYEGYSSTYYAFPEYFRLRRQHNV